MALESLTSSFPSLGGSANLGNFGPRVRALEASLNLIQASIHLPLNLTKKINDALSQLDKLRDRMDKANSDLSSLTRNPSLDSELNKVQVLLDSITILYKAKRNTLENSINPNNAGAFSAIKNAYDESTNAVKKVDISGSVVKESADIREQVTDLHNKVQSGNTRDLDKLKQSMTSRPDLTPVAKVVCGRSLSEPCTPLQCQGQELCPLERTPTCEAGENCVGALPLSKRAVIDSMAVKDRLETLNVKITEAAEKLQVTQETTNQVRQSAEKLSNKMKHTRDELEEDLKEARDVVKELKDFLSDPSSNLTHIQEVSNWILNAKLPLNLATLKRKLDELKNLAASLPDSTDVLKEAEPQLDKARKLLQKAQDARDTALGVKADVDGLLVGFGSMGDSMSDLAEKLQNSTNLIDNLKENLTKVKNQMVPAEEALDDVLELLRPMKPQLDEFKHLLQDGGQQAQDAQENADKAEDKATAANEDMVSLRTKLDHLKDQAAASSEAGPLGDRLAKLQQDAGALANTTENMMKTLEGKADSLRSLQDHIVQKSTKLKGLDAKLKDLISQLRKQAQYLSTCRS